MCEYGKKIKEARKKAGLTQKGLAKKAGVAAVTIQQYETNKRQPKLEQLRKLAEAMEISIDELLGIKPLPPKKHVLNPNTEQELVIEDDDFEVANYELYAFSDFLEELGYKTFIDAKRLDNPKGKDGDVWVMHDGRENKAYFATTKDLDNLMDNIMSYAKFQIKEMTDRLRPASEEEYSTDWRAFGVFHPRNGKWEE